MYCNGCVDYNALIRNTMAYECTYNDGDSRTKTLLKKELPALKIRPGTSEEHQADVKNGQENSKL